MTSTEEINMRLQQYRFNPKESSTFAGSSPALTLDWKALNLSPINVPQVKQRMGIIISDHR